MLGIERLSSNYDPQDRVRATLNKSSHPRLRIQAMSRVLLNAAG